MRKLFLLFILFLFYSCSSISLEEDPIVQKHFSDLEIAYLDSVLTFFDNEVVNQTPSTEIIPSYKELFEIVKDSAESGPTIAIEIDGQKYDRLFLELPDSLKNEFWYTGYSQNSNTGDSTFFRDLIPSRKYAAFLKSSSERNDFLLEYYDDLQHATGISPDMNANMLLFPEKLDKNERECLIYAVHFITLRRPSAH